MCRSPVPVLALALCLAPCAVEGDRDVLGLAREVSVAEHTLGRSGWLGLATSEGATVCCLLSLEPNFKVEIYNAGRAQSDVKKCLLIGLVDGCSEQAACASSCAEYMKGARRYHDLLAEKAKNEATAARQTQKQEFSLTDKKLQTKFNTAKLDFENTVKIPRAEAKQAARALEAAKKDREAKEKVFQDAKKVLEAAEALSQEKKAKEESQSQLAEASMTKAKTQAQADADTERTEAAKKLAEKEKTQAEKQQQAASFSAKTVPVECADSSSSSGAKDCCCAIGGQAMRVSGELFVDWDKCKGGEAYAKTSSLSLPCDFFTQCNKCADLICPNGKCPA